MPIQDWIGLDWLGLAWLGLALMFSFSSPILCVKNDYWSEVPESTCGICGNWQKSMPLEEKESKKIRRNKIVAFIIESIRMT